MHARRRTLLARALLIAAALALVAPATAVAQPGPPPGGSPGTDQIVSSRNMTQLANIPKQGPFASPLAYGSDIAFQGNLAYVGNYEGFVVYDIRNPRRPSIVSQVQCPGAQNDITVSGNLLFLSTDSRRTDNTCTSAPAAPVVAGGPVATDYWEGIKVFDIRDPRRPRYVAAVETDCGSHTHTLVPDTRGRDVYLYVSSYAPNPQLADCQPPHDKISIVKVPLRNPAAAAIVAEPVLFPDGGNPGPGSDTTSGCHDITVYPSRNIAAGACMGDGILLDITNRERPVVTERVRDDVNFAFWHSATFNNAGTKVVFTDELGGGGAPTCNATTGPTRGANGIYDLVGGQLEFRSYYKIPRFQQDSENCVAHNGSLIPVKGKDIMVQAWYQGGVSVWDFTDSSAPREIGFWERGPLPPNPIPGAGVGGSWSAYWYNGHIYSSDIQKGLDVLQIRDPATNSARGQRFDIFNAQTQPEYGVRRGRDDDDDDDD